MRKYSDVLLIVLIIVAFPILMLVAKAFDLVDFINGKILYRRLRGLCDKYEE